MSLIGVILGSFFQLGLAYFIFMIIAFSAGGAVNGQRLSELQIKILDMCLFVLPSLCLVAAGIVIYQYMHGGASSAYWWYGMPIVATIVYVVFVSRL